MEAQLAEYFKEHDWKWKRSDGTYFVPDEDDISAVLDEAAVALYSEAVGSQLEVGRLIIQKKHKGHDVYVYVGPYE